MLCSAAHNYTAESQSHIAARKTVRKMQQAANEPKLAFSSTRRAINLAIKMKHIVYRTEAHPMLGNRRVLTHFLWHGDAIVHLLLLLRIVLFLTFSIKYLLFNGKRG